jgi:uncharacterized protein
METPELQHDPMLAEIVWRLVEAYQPERIFLFGSRARGDAGPDSDYDLMVVPDAAPPPMERSRRTREALRGLGVGSASDVLVWTREEFEKRLHLKASLPSTILREGRLLYTVEPAPKVMAAIHARLPAETHP